MFTNHRHRGLDVLQRRLGLHGGNDTACRVAHGLIDRVLRVGIAHAQLHPWVQFVLGPQLENPLVLVQFAEQIGRVPILEQHVHRQQQPSVQ